MWHPGLQHEHQRPDRDIYLKYIPKNLEGYAEAVKEADDDEKCVFEDDDTAKYKKMMMLVFKSIIALKPSTDHGSRTEHADHAKYYFPQALPFIKGDNMQGDKWKFYKLSHTFDFDSIMMYNSDRFVYP